MAKRLNKRSNKKFSKGYHKTKRVNNMHVGGSIATAKDYFIKNFKEVTGILTEREKELLGAEDLDISSPDAASAVFEKILTYKLTT